MPHRHEHDVQRLEEWHYQHIGPYRARGCLPCSKQLVYSLASFQPSSDTHLDASITFCVTAAHLKNNREAAIGAQQR